MDTLDGLGESAKAEATEVSADFEGLEDVAPDSGGEEFTDDGGADGGWAALGRISWSSSWLAALTC